MSVCVYLCLCVRVASTYTHTSCLTTTPMPLSCGMTLWKPSAHVSKKRDNTHTPSLHCAAVHQLRFYTCIHAYMHLSVNQTSHYMHPYTHACIHPCIHTPMHPSIHASIQTVIELSDKALEISVKIRMITMKLL
jgi:hypothetical protein